MQGFSNAESSSQKILERLRDIRRTYHNQGSIYAANSAAIQSQHISTDSHQSRLNKYLPDSVARQTQDWQPGKAVSHMQENRDNDHYAFKKQLQSKLETLFNEEKSLLRNRYDMNDDEYDIQKKDQLLDKQRMVSMQRKVRQLENRYTNSKPPKVKIRGREGQRGKQVTNKSTKQKIQNEQQVNQLRQALLQTKLLNQRLSQKLLKRKLNKSDGKDEFINKLSEEVKSLKKQLEELKSKQGSQYVLCNAKMKSRDKSVSSFTPNHKEAEHNVLPQIYCQIQELQLRLMREQKQKLDLQQKNSWLESQLQKYLN